MKDLKKLSLEELWRLFPIILKEHNPNYKTWYDEEKEALLRLLGDEVRRVSHIGSTSVDGLTAKPIVDILLEVREGYDMDAVTRLLQDDGWILMARNAAGKTLDLNKGYTPEGFAEKVWHLHVKPLGDWGELYFRDYLRKYPDVARQYERLKSRLLEQFEYDRDAYTNAKSDFIATYTRKAREEFAGRYSPQTLDR